MHPSPPCCMCCPCPTDNGPEFAARRRLEALLGKRVYFAQPYCLGRRDPWARQQELLAAYP